MAHRPYLNSSIDDLEAEFAAAGSAKNSEKLSDIAHELTFRKTPRARELALEVTKLQQPQPPSSKPSSSAPNNRNSTTGNRTPNSPAIKLQPDKNGRHPPTVEQAEAIEHFLKRNTLKINAYAGTGKTSTLQMLAASTTARGQYIAFNKSIVADAKSKFPNSVNCSTIHGLAFRAMAPTYSGNTDKLAGKTNANQLAELLKLQKWRIDRDHSLAPRSQGYLILETIRRFAQSSDSEPALSHVPLHGSLKAASEATLNVVRDFAVRGAKHVWEKMKSPDDSIPLGHDGYLKLWAQTDPRIAADFILLDEAQDTNPVVLDVLKRQSAQMIYVGDRYQQIYEWRGAVNAMEIIDTESSTYLTTSFRFGPVIADGAAKILSMLGESRPLNGNPKLKSRIGATDARTILARTNASTITAVIEAIDGNRRPHLVGGNGELMEMLKGVQSLKANEPSNVPDFFGFGNWNEVVEFAKSGEGAHLLTFVNLVDSRGEKQLMWALNRTVDEANSDITVSTAHKAKGREWPTVRLMDDFLRSQPRRGPDGSKDGGNSEPEPSELRLFYVALTRAKESIEVPAPLLSITGITADSIAARPMYRNGEGMPPIQGAKSSASTKMADWKPPVSWNAPTDPSRTSQPTAGVPVNRSQGRKEEKPKSRGLLNWLFGG